MPILIKPSIKFKTILFFIIFENNPLIVVGINTKRPTENIIAKTKDIAIITSFALSLNTFFKNLSIASSSSSSSIKNSEE